MLKFFNPFLIALFFVNGDFLVKGINGIFIFLIQRSLFSFNGISKIVRYSRGTISKNLCLFILKLVDIFVMCLPRMLLCFPTLNLFFRIRLESYFLFIAIKIVLNRDLGLFSYSGFFHSLYGRITI